MIFSGYETDSSQRGSGDCCVQGELIVRSQEHFSRRTLALSILLFRSLQWHVTYNIVITKNEIIVDCKTRRLNILRNSECRRRPWLVRNLAAVQTGHELASGWSSKASASSSHSASSTDKDVGRCRADRVTSLPAATSELSGFDEVFSVDSSAIVPSVSRCHASTGCTTTSLTQHHYVTVPTGRPASGADFADPIESALTTHCLQYCGPSLGRIAAATAAAAAAAAAAETIGHWWLPYIVYTRPEYQHVELIAMGARYEPYASCQGYQ